MYTLKQNKIFLVTGFILQLVFILLIVLTGVYRLNYLNSHFDKILYGHSLQKDYLRQMRNSVRDRSITVWKSTLTNDLFIRNSYYEELLHYGTQFIHAHQQYVKSDLSVKEKELLQRMSASVLKINPIIHSVTENLNIVQDYSYKEEMSRALPLQQLVVKTLDELLYLHTSKLENIQSDIRIQLAQTLHLMMILMTVVFILAFIFAVMINHRSRKMLTAVSNSESALTMINVDLEEIVKRRTTELEEANNKLKSIANSDSLTGLANRFMLFSKMDQILSYAKRNKELVAVLFMDLDGFKPINDKYGHEVGDIILVEIANRINSLTRESDIAARLGGDEFIIVLSRINKHSNASTLVEKLIADIERPIFIKELNKSLTISASIGLSFYPDDGDSAKLLIKQADSAMYVSKRSKTTNKKR